MFYKYKITYYNEVEDKDVTDMGVVYGTNYSNAVFKVVEDYGVYSKNDKCDNYDDYNIVSIEITKIYNNDCNTITLEELNNI